LVAESAPAIEVTRLDTSSLDGVVNHA